MTVQELDIQMESLQGEIRAGSDALLAMTGDRTVTMEALEAKKAEVEGLRARYAMLQQEKAARLASFRERRETPKAAMSRKEAAGMYFRAVLNGSGLGALPKMAYEQLGAIPADNADQGNGSKLMPHEMANELLLEPSPDNPLRGHMTVTNITGLELPKLTFDLSDDDFAAKDGETAKELAMSADNIAFGRHKMHLIAKVSESVLRASPLDIEGAVWTGLKDAQTRKELKVIFAQDPAAGEEHMSLYAKDEGKTNTLIKTVGGATLFDAILAAYADLEDAYRARAQVCMRYADYATMIRDMAGHESLFLAKPEQVLGIPVIFCDSAATPVVGDWRFLHLNYDCDPWVDTGKDLPTGNRLFDSTALYDVRIKMLSAFRLASVS